MEFLVRKAERKDVALVYQLIKGLATYEKRPQDVTGSVEELEHWLFDKNIASVLIGELDGKAMAYAMYYPVFGSFSAAGKVHLEDFFITEEHRGKGLGGILMANVSKEVLACGYTGMEWSALDWNEAAIGFYSHLGAEKECGRVYMGFEKSDLEKIAAECNV